jgi:glycosyltransferase involved in cell wall biosynthesis
VLSNFQVSVIIPTFNRAHTLERALDSVLAQTLAPVEVIVVDDGSTDGTESIIQTHFPNIIYVKQDNHGVSAARNAGIKRARGEWIALLDSDDSWVETKLAAQHNCLLNTPGVRLCHTEEIWIRNGVRVNAMRKHKKQGGHIYTECLPLCVISPSASVIHQSLFDETGLFDETLPACEDYDLWLRICSREAVAFVESPQIIKFGGHTDQLSRSHWGMDRFRITSLQKMLDSDMLEEGQRAATIDMLTRKASILRKGAEKRGNTERADYYRAMQKQYSTSPLETAS